MRHFDGHCLRDIRRERGMSRDQLAAAAARSSQSVIMYEQGRGLPSVRTVAALADVLGVEIDELFIEVDASPARAS